MDYAKKWEKVADENRQIGQQADNFECITITEGRFVAR